MDLPPYDVVVLDTTTLWSHLRLDGVHFKVLFAGAHFAASRLAIPQVVLEEAARHFTDRWKEASDKLASAHRDFDKLGATIKSSEPGSLNQSYPFAKADAWPVAITVLPYPDVHHAELVRRDLDRRKPFALTGKGYRDALTWYSILELAGTSEKIAFITNNTSDFAQSKEGQLHSDLVRDLPARVTVDLYTSVEQFNKKHIHDRMQQMEEMREALDSGTYPSFDASEWVRASAESFVPLPYLLHVLNEADGEPWVLDEIHIDPDPAVRVTSVRFLGHQQYLLELRLEMKVRATLRNQAAWEVVAGELWMGPEHKEAHGTIIASITATFDAATKTITGATTVGLEGPRGHVSVPS